MFKHKEKMSFNLPTSLEIKLAALYKLFETRVLSTCLLATIKGHVTAVAGHFLIGRRTVRSSELPRKLSTIESVIMWSLLLV